MEQNVLYYLKKLLIYKNAFGFCEFYLDIVFYLFLPKQYSNNSYMAVSEYNSKIIWKLIKKLNQI